MLGTIGVIDGNCVIGMRKIERVMLLIKVINNGRFTLSELSVKLEISERSTYRYLHLLQSLEFDIECDFDKKYFIAGHCPICNATSNHKH
jgi:hypothetical protein